MIAAPEPGFELPWLALLAGGIGALAAGVVSAMLFAPAATPAIAARRRRIALVVLVALLAAAWLVRSLAAGA